MSDTHNLMMNAWRGGIVIPAFNIPYLPMMEPVIQAMCDTECFGLITVARLEWVKFGAKGLREIHSEYKKIKNDKYTRLHLDHVPVVDEDGFRVDYENIIGEALELGYESVMVDGSRLPLEENITATGRIVSISHNMDVPVEGEIGAVLGHEEGPIPPYEEIFNSGNGFTDPAEAKYFIEATGVDWLSVAIGNIHGAITEARKAEKKASARLNIKRLDEISKAVKIPIVLHGGSGIKKEYLLQSFKHGIAKINVGTAIRQQYEKYSIASARQAREAVYNTTVGIITEDLEIKGSARIINPVTII